MKNILLLTGILLVNLLNAQTFTLIGLPDTQKYTKEEDGGVKEMFYAQTQWIADNVDAENIVFVSHFGDITDDGSNPGALIQWEYADIAMTTLEESDYSVDGIPYAVLPGNHDKFGGMSNYTTYFGIDRFVGRWYYGDGYQGNENSYCLFSASGMDFILVSIEYNPSNSYQIAWADGILSTYSDRRAIVVSHSILETDGTWSTDGGENVYNMAKDHDNVFLMLCGHNHGEIHRTDTYNGNTIHTVLSDYQDWTNGGDGYLRIMQFDPDNDVINFKTYSPWLDEWSTTSESQFSLPYDMDGGTTTNNPPQIQNQNFSLAENTANGQSVATVVATDPDAGQTLSFSIIAGNTDNAFQINSTSGLITVNNSQALDFETNPSFGLTIKVTDNGDIPLSDQATITIDLADVNESPEISNQTFDIDENSADNTTIGQIEANDPDYGQSLTYTITGGNSSNTFALDAGTGILTVNDGSVLNYESITEFSLTVQVQDNGSGNLTSEATITIDVNDVNEYPTVSDDEFNILENLGNNEVVGEVSANDPDIGQTLTFSIINGNTDNAFAIGSNTGILAVNNNNAVNFETTPVFTLTVEVTDNGALNLSTTAQIIVNLEDINEVPAISDQEFDIDENSPSNTVVGQVVALDPDIGQSLSFSIISGNTSNAFALDPASGTLSIDNSEAFDFESMPVFNLSVQVLDNGAGNLSASAIITVNLNDVNETPEIDDQNFSIEENSGDYTILGTITASDPDAGQVLSFSIISGNNDNAFTVDPSTGELSVSNSTALDYETYPLFTLTIMVEDNGTVSLSSQANISIELIDINESPIIQNQSFSVEENASNGTIVGTIVGSDPDIGQTIYFSIISGNYDNAFQLNENTGELTVLNGDVLNFETISQFLLLVQVVDNATSSLSDEAEITVDISDLNEPPHVEDQNFSIAMGSPANTYVGTVEAFDPDIGQSLTFSILSGNTDEAFFIDENTGSIYVLNEDAIDGNIAAFNLTVEVIDNGTNPLGGQASVIIDVIQNNQAPVIEDQLFYIDENSISGTIVGTVIATDPDPDQTLTFSIASGNADIAFEIEPETGNIKVFNELALNFEITPTFQLQIQVEDNGPGTLSSQATVTINLNDVNEAPVIEDQIFIIEENLPIGFSVGTVIAYDPDFGQLISYSITNGNTEDAFAIDQFSGEITVANSEALNYLINPEINLDVFVEDNGTSPLFSNATITVQLTQVFVGMKELQSEKMEFSLSPNPAINKTVLQIKNLDSQANFQFAIYNLRGELIETYKTDVYGSEISEVIDLTNFNPGTYIVKIYNGSAVEVGKLVKL